MKKAILYVRVSTDEQAEKDHSLAFQEERLRQYCSLNGIEIVAFFKEDYSAKTFERPEFKKLLAFLKKKKHVADLLLFLKWDRFSRNIAEAYSMIKQLADLDIEPQSIEQPLDMKIPESKIMLAIYLATPEVENDRRAMNVKDGMYKAIKAGRWMGIAPKGYKRSVDENLKPCIIPGNDGPLVKWAFEQMATGAYAIDDVRKMVNGKGLKVSRNAFWCLLRHPVYIAKMKVPAYKGEPEMVVTAKHPAIVSDALFYEVQEVLDGKRKINHPTVHCKREPWPLRGFLKCPRCGRSLTGSTSKGNGGIYYYYHCIKGCKERHKANEVNDGFYGQLTVASRNEKAIRSYELIFKNSAVKNGKDKVTLMNKYQQELDTNKKRLQNAQTLMLDGQLNPGDYQDIRSKLQPQIEKLMKEITVLDHKNPEENNMKDFGFLYLRNVDKIFKAATLEEKHRIVGLTYPEKMTFQNGAFQTTNGSDIISLLCRPGKVFSDKKGKPQKNFCGLSQEVTPSGFKPETF